MDFYSILVSILRRLPGCVFVVVYIVHGILAVGGGGPPHPLSLGTEEGRDPGVPTPLASIVRPRHCRHRLCRLRRSQRRGRR